jgi:hypothetical protein
VFLVALCIIDPVVFSLQETFLSAIHSLFQERAANYGGKINIEQRMMHDVSLFLLSLFMAIKHTFIYL